MAQEMKGNYTGLAWVQDELQQLLADALQSLTRFIDDPHDSMTVSPCINALTQVAGTLEMLELEGALLLNKEMLASANQILSQSNNDTVQLQDSLLKSLLLLPNYLKQIGHNVSDHPLRLLNTINELRLSRDDNIITADSLFVVDLFTALPDAISSKAHDSALKNSVSLSKMSHAFQTLLVNWIKNNDSESLKKLSQIVHYLRINCNDDRSITLWWIAEGLIEAINDSGIASDTKTKLSLGKLNAPIKLLTQHDEQYLLSHFPTKIAQQLLLLVAQSSSSGTYVSLLKDTYNLNFYDQAIHQKIYSSTDNAQTQARVAILEKLSEVKKQLQQFDPNDSSSFDALDQFATQFSNVTHSLELINEQAASQMLHQHQIDLSTALDKTELLSDQQLMALADDLLRVENMLNQTSLLTEQEDIQSIVIEECLHELANIKEKLILLENKYLSNDDFINDSASQLALIAGSTSMLNLSDATQLLEDLAITIAEHDADSGGFTANEFIFLAEIISAIELFLKGLSQHGQQQTKLITHAQYQLDNLEQLAYDNANTQLTKTHAEDSIQPRDAVPEKHQKTRVEHYIQQRTADLEKQQKTGVERYIQQRNATPVERQKTSVERYIQHHASQTLASIESDLELVTQIEPHRNDQPVPSNQFSEIESSESEALDLDISDIFTLEARDIIAQLNTLMPNGKSIANREDLSTVRRHFHSLKGSGRVAGADLLAELAGSVENLLNNAIDNQIELSTTAQEIITDSHRLLPLLLGQFKQNDLSGTNDVDKIKADINVLLLAENEQTDANERELRHIFNDEASQHIRALKDYLTDAAVPFHINKAILQTTHSLQGCANVAAVKPIATVSDALDDKLRHFYRQDSALSDSQLSVLNKVAEDLEILFSALITAEDNEEKVDRLLTLIGSLEVEQPSAVKPFLRLDPEILSIFLEETEALTTQYQASLEQSQQQPDDSHCRATLQQTLAELTESAHCAQIAELSEIYQSISSLTSQDDLSNPDITKLLAAGAAKITDIIKALMENQSPASIEDYTSQVKLYVDSLTAYSISVTDTEQAQDSTALNGLFAIPGADDDLLNTFTEECAELLASSGAAIQQWQKTPENTQVMLQLQRDLHTLKGGARLTAIEPIADLAHYIESLASLISDQKINSNDAFFELLQRCQDRLADMQQQLSQSTHIVPAIDLIAEIERFSLQSNPNNLDIGTTKPTSTLDSTIEKKAATTAPTANHSHSEQVRVKAELLDFLTNFAGEVNISRDRVSQQNSAIRQQLNEMASTVERLQEQLRKLEMETEAQILFRYEDNASQGRSEFDPLELDRFSQMQQLSRGLSESVSDLHDITHSIDDLVQESDTVLADQSRLSTELQQGLMSTRLLPFSGLLPRFERLIRQSNNETDKHSKLIVYGSDRKLDRNILEHIIAPIEHILRNAISHGIESPEERERAGKDDVATITLTITRDGSETLITIADDGRGIDIAKVRQKAIENNLIAPDQSHSDDELIHLILHSGFSTSNDLSQLSGRGIGMDIVNSEIRTLKGRLTIQSVSGQGTSFNIRIPLSLATMQALIVNCADEQYAIPLASVQAGAQISVKEAKRLLDQDSEENYQYKGVSYKLIPFANLLNQPFKLPDDQRPQLPILLFNSTDIKVALVMDSVSNNREIVLKSLGVQLDHITAINGATILGSGQVALVLDIPTLISTTVSMFENPLPAANTLAIKRPIAMIVDDSVTMRKASGNFLKRHGFDIITASDGIDGTTLLNEKRPDVILLDVEMPRMDGFEFAALVKSDPQFNQIPIIMITSRTGDKHRNQALQTGVNAYLGKPYQEGELVDTLQNLLGVKYPSQN